MSKWIMGSVLVAFAGCAGEPSDTGTGQPSATPAAAPEAKAPASPATPVEAKSPLAKNLDVAQAVQLLKDNAEVVVLDVRTPNEFATGHIAKALNIDYKADDFDAQLAALDRKATYLVHCRSGNRSTATFGTLLDLGFESLYHLDGGLLAWEAAGQPVEK